MGNNISDEDKQLFRQSQEKVQRLKSSGKIIKPKKQPKAKKTKQPDFLQENIPLNKNINVEKVHCEEILFFSQSGVQPRTLRQLRQGKLPIESSLDLHGLTIAAAEKALQQFIDKHLQQNARILRIIHGKGHSSKQQTPPLKNLVNQFLQSHPFVLAFCSAPQNDGGAGAVYVLLKKDLS